MSIHKKISFAKSAIRILGYVTGAFFSGQNAGLLGAFAILIGSEVLGVIEEFGEK